jgi:hypothetical protein
MDINHPGPFLGHLSKVPDGQDIHTYDGSGDWVKIFTLGLGKTGDPDTPYVFLAWNGPFYQKGEYEYRLPGRVCGDSVVHPNIRGATADEI